MQNLPHTHVGNNALKFAENVGVDLALTARPTSSVGIAFTEMWQAVQPLNSSNARNDQGETLEIGIVLSKDEAINAHYYSVTPRGQLVCIDSGIYLAFQEIAFAILACEQVCTQLPSLSRAPDTDLFRIVPLGTVWKKFGDLREYQHLRDASLPLSEDRKQYATMLVCAMLFYVVYHEIGHAMAGHHGLVLNGGLGAINESGTSIGSIGARSPERQLSEIQADDFAFFRLMSSFTKRVFLYRFPHALRDNTECDSLLLLAGSLVCNLWPWIDGSYRYEREEILDVSSHPAGVIRASEFYAIANDVSWFGHTGLRRDKVPSSLSQEESKSIVDSRALMETDKNLDAAKAFYPEFFSFYPRSGILIDICKRYNEKVLSPARTRFRALTQPHSFRLKISPNHHSDPS